MSSEHVEARDRASDQTSAWNGVSQFVIRLDLQTLLWRTTVTVVTLTLLTIGALIFRIEREWRGAYPGSPPPSWLFDFTANLVRPFEDVSTPAMPGAPFVDYAALVAIELYAAAGLCLALVTGGLTSLVRNLGIGVVEIEPRRVPGLARYWSYFVALAGVRRAAAASGIAARTTWTGGRTVARDSAAAARATVTYVKTRDWPAYRRRARLTYERADRVSERVAAALDGAGLALARAGRRRLTAGVGYLSESGRDAAASIRLLWMGARDALRARLDAADLPAKRERLLAPFRRGRVLYERLVFAPRIAGFSGVSRRWFLSRLVGGYAGLSTSAGAAGSTAVAKETAVETPTLLVSSESDTGGTAIPPA